MADWYCDFMDDGILNRDRYVDPWTDITDKDFKSMKEEENQTIQQKLAKCEVQQAEAMRKLQ
jgi:hypothetical protein